ncbi:protein SRC2 [Rosa sericea]
MDCRTLEIRLLSADQIKNVNNFSTMDVYAVVSVSGGADKHKFITPIHKNCGTHPRWNHPPFTFTLDDAALNQNRLTLKIKLISDRTLKETKIGKVVIPVSQLPENSGKDNLPYVTYTVLRPKEKPQGYVTFVYKFGEKFWAPLPVQPKAQKEVLEQPRSLMSMPQPQAEYEYSSLLHLSYGYPLQPQAEYEHSSIVQQSYEYPIQ